MTGDAAGEPLFSRPIRPHYPVVILGAGINGCGLFRDLAAQGLDCLLVDKGDFCSGASAGPSRLIHGGIKYLETGEFRLVRESALERNLLLKTAPHYVRPLETVLPVRSLWGGIVPSLLRFLRRPAKLDDRGALITWIGLTLYDLYGRHFQSMPKHRFLSGSRMRREMPELAPEISAIGIYYEGRISHAERLGLELVRDGLELNAQSTARNYTAVVGHDDDAVVLRDAARGEDYTVRCDVVVNAGGAWIDKINAALGVNSRHIGGNKGAHLVVSHRRLHDALNGRMVYFGTRDGRVNLVYPFMGNVLVGSTDVPIADPDEATCDPAEFNYLLGVVSEVFPAIRLTPADVVFSYWGVRPLPRSDGLDPRAVSRDHHVAEDRLPGSSIPILSLIGGKWTTFRGFSEEVADRILALVGRSRTQSTRTMAIGGGRGFPVDAAAREAFADALARSAGVTAQAAKILLGRYGTTASSVAAALGRDGHRPLAALAHYTEGEIRHLCRTEAVVHLTDLLFRRTDIALSGQLSEPVIAETARLAAAALGWDEARAADEIFRAGREAELHGVALRPGTARAAT